MQEAQARQDVSVPEVPSITNLVQEPSSSGETAMAVDEDDEDAQLAKALALSQGEDVEMVDEGDLDEQEEIARAIAMSNENPEGEDQSGKK